MKEYSENQKNSIIDDNGGNKSAASYQEDLSNPDDDALIGLVPHNSVLVPQNFVSFSPIDEIEDDDEMDGEPDYDEDEMDNDVDQEINNIQEINNKRDNKGFYNYH